MLDDSAISDSLDVDSSQRDLFLCGRNTPKLAEVRAPHCPPSDDNISLSHLPLNRHHQIRVPPHGIQENDRGTPKARLVSTPPRESDVRATCFLIQRSRSALNVPNDPIAQRRRPRGASTA